MASTKIASKYKIPSLANNHYWLLIVGSALYILLTATAPIQNNKFHISIAQLRLIQVSFVIPILLIWWMAFYGAVRFKNYSLVIKDSADGRGFDQVSNGLLVLAYGFLIQTVFSSLKTRLLTTNHLRSFTIINNYMAIIFPLVAFGLMLIGTAKLSQLNKQHDGAYSQIALLVIAVAAFATLFTFSLLKNPYRYTNPDPSQFSSYYLSDGLIWATIILPNIMIWTFGVLSIARLKAYAINVKGLIYRNSLERLVQGLIVVVALSIGLNLLSTIGPSLVDLNLAAILILVYILVALYGLGFLVIAIGAKKLSKIEEV